MAKKKFTVRFPRKDWRRLHQALEDSYAAEGQWPTIKIDPETKEIVVTFGGKHDGKSDGAVFLLKHD